MSDQAWMRVGRTERDRCIDHLSRMFSQEYLTEEEFRERADRAAEAKTQGDLKRLVQDLPPIPSGSLAVPKQRRPVMQVVGPRARPAAWSFLALLTSLAVMIIPDYFAAMAYHGLGNSPFAIYGVTMFGGGICAFISFLFFLGNAFDRG